MSIRPGRQVYSPRSTTATPRGTRAPAPTCVVRPSTITTVTLRLAASELPSMREPQRRATVPESGAKGALATTAGAIDIGAMQPARKKHEMTIGLQRLLGWLIKEEYCGRDGPANTGGSGCFLPQPGCVDYGTYQFRIPGRDDVRTGDARQLCKLLQHLGTDLHAGLLRVTRLLQPHRNLLGDECSAHVCAEPAHRLDRQQRSDGDHERRPVREPGCDETTHVTSQQS